eukprot:2120759-Rhodomonas_salina.1
MNRIEIANKISCAVTSTQENSNPVHTNLAPPNKLNCPRRKLLRHRHAETTIGKRTIEVKRLGLRHRKIAGRKFASSCPFPIAQNPSRPLLRAQHKTTRCHNPRAAQGQCHRAP